MSMGPGCKDRLRHRPWWRVIQRNCNHSKFNGRHYTPSAYSEIACTVKGCGRHWRTKGKYVDDIPDITGSDIDVYHARGYLIDPEVALHE